MGTYTTNYNLFMPTVGETGWGELVNTNFSTIDSTMKSLSNKITAIENEVNGNLSCTSVTTSGKVTGNGGIAGTTGTFSGAVTGASFNGVTIKSSGVYTVTPSTSGSMYIPLGGDSAGSITILPFHTGCTYTGSLTFIGDATSGLLPVITYWDGSSTRVKTLQCATTGTLRFTQIPYLVCTVSSTSRNIYLRKFTIS